MRCFLVLLSDKKANGLTPELLLAHVHHLQQLAAAGQLRFCGPYADNQGAMLLLLCTDRQQAEQLLQADPFIHVGYYKQYQLQEVLEANAANHWLLQDTQTNSNLTAGI
ncbi:YciI family protein [Shewanella dokdonensis]|uniref:YCII-related domain-containing protein n=1 Tax=Shewanella dokdonensis TaxID=712036 RepID=A0ABX8DHS0_9GAMM|nr:YciI family protein [Shewanella dokdonensis]MCL1074220.1 YciI family protein [Shewanella dokdonensis]QVK23930.1 hypothetical protein KHX94_04610 [Shewanella dokdonensis]